MNRQVPKLYIGGYTPDFDYDIEPPQSSLFEPGSYSNLALGSLPIIASILGGYFLKKKLSHK